VETIITTFPALLLFLLPSCRIITGKLFDTWNQEDAMGDRASWEQLDALIARGNPREVEDYVAALPSAQLALSITRLDDKARTKMIMLLAPDEAADMLRDLPEGSAAQLISEVPPAAAAAIVDRLPRDEQVDLLGDLGKEAAEAILSAMPPADAEGARELLQYAPDTAGGLMTSEYLSYPATTLIGDLILDFERNSQRYIEYQVQYSYITGAEGQLVGVLRLRDLLLAPRSAEVASVMIPNPLFVSADTPLSQLVQLFDDYHFTGVPVVDPAGRLEGVVERRAVEEAQGREERNSFLQISGIVGGEEYRSSAFLTRVLRRLAWLTPNIALNILAASVIALYQDTLRAAIALAVFLPIISDMSGCSGNQAVAVSIRELALGLIKPGEFTRIFMKESTLGLVNGIVLGILLGAVAFLWKENYYLSVVVAAALAANTLLSVLIGGSVPLALKRFRMDPALASGPILTTITDMCGFFLVLSLASSVLDKL
jgi:magnesium transporter